MYVQVSQLEGVYSVHEPHFWTLCSDVYVGALKLEVAANADVKYIQSQAHNIFTAVSIVIFFWWYMYVVLFRSLWPILLSTYFWLIHIQGATCRRKEYDDVIHFVFPKVQFSSQVCQLLIPQYIQLLLQKTQQYCRES